MRSYCARAGRAVLLSALLIAAAARCSWLLPYQPSADRGRETVASDAARDGAPWDRVVGELLSADRDGHPVDAARTDGLPVDRALDRKPVDKATTPEKPKLDKPMAVDQPPKPDTGAPPCALGSTIKQTYGPTMVACGSPSAEVQCSAEARCNVAGGWHLCTATEFRNRGGTTVAGMASAWIASCARNNGKDNPTPTDSVCPTCSTATSPSFTIASWECVTGADGFGSDRRELGVITSMICHRVGGNLAANEARWVTYAAGDAQTGSLCCR